MSRPLGRRWYKLLGVGPLLLLLAFLPNLLYVDHWGDFLDAGRGGVIPPDHVAERLQHGAHCHFGPSSCSDQPVLANMQSIPRLIEFPEPEFRDVLVAENVTALEEVVVSPPTEPPRL